MPAMPALEPTAASPPGDAWRMLPSGALACQLPPTKEGKPVWLDALLGVKLCEHGHSAGQIHHWRCAARPRAKPEWVTCTCTDAKGLCMDARVKPALPADVPAYHRVLWRDSEPVLLEAKGRWGVPVPGKPKGHDVFLADTLVGNRDWENYLERHEGAWIRDRVNHNSHAIVIRKRRNGPRKGRPFRPMHKSVWPGRTPKSQMAD